MLSHMNEIHRNQLMKIVYQKKLLGLLIQHVPSGQIVEFKAFITGLSDNYSSKWNAQDVYGRMDPIATFQGTRRNINVFFQTLLPRTKGDPLYRPGGCRFVAGPLARFFINSSDHA